MHQALKTANSVNPRATCQVQKRRRLNALNTVVSLLREQLKISATIGTSAAAATQPVAKSAAGDATSAAAASADAAKVNATLPDTNKSFLHHTYISARVVIKTWRERVIGKAKIFTRKPR